jgi:hypothetical protein
MMPKPDSVKLVGVCEHCGEQCAIVLNRKQAKLISKAFKQDLKQAVVTLDKATEAGHEQ